jgi:hypothetical protein
MAIDPSIALSIRPPQVPDTATTLGKMMQMRRERMQMMLQQREQQLREEAAARQRELYPAQRREVEANATAAETRSRKDLEDEADTAVMHKAWGQAAQEERARQAAGDTSPAKTLPERTMEILGEGNQPRAAFKYNGIMLQQQGEGARRDHEMLQTEKESHEMVADILRSDTSDFKHKAILDMLEGMKKQDPRWQQAINELDPNYAQTGNPSRDQNRIDALMARGMSAASQNQEAQRAVTWREHAIGLARERIAPLVSDYPDGDKDPHYMQAKEVYDRAVTENKPKELVLNTGYAANRLARVQNGQDYTNTVDLLRRNGIPQDVIDSFGPYNAQFAKNAATKALTVEQEKTLDVRYLTQENQAGRIYDAELRGRQGERDRQYAAYAREVEKQRPTGEALRALNRQHQELGDYEKGYPKTGKEDEFNPKSQSDWEKSQGLNPISLPAPIPPAGLRTPTAAAPTAPIAGANADTRVRSAKDIPGTFTYKIPGDATGRSITVKTDAEKETLDNMLRDIGVPFDGLGAGPAPGSGIKAPAASGAVPATKGTKLQEEPDQSNELGEPDENGEF